MARLEEIQNLLFKHATRGPDSFRQWYYYRYPKSYTVNPLVNRMIKQYLQTTDINNAEIAQLIIKRATHDYFRDNR